MLQTIKQGYKGDIVKVAQYLTGYCEMKKASGTFDAAFFMHIKGWQQKNGLEADGIIGQKTWSKIASTALTCSLKKNSKSVYTCAAQILIGGITVDGIYGQKTKNAVAAYQSANGLSADGICGPKTWNSLIHGSSVIMPEDQTQTENTNSKAINKCVHYLQWDSKWKNIKYSTHTSAQTIGNSGCGPTSMAMIMATWIDPKITPVEMCELAVKGGYRTYDSGTSWGFYKYVFDKYNGFSKYLATSSVETLKGALANGALAVCSMNSNDNRFWTSGGHFIVAIGYDSEGYIYANDPNKKECPRKQKQDKFKSCLKQAFIFWPEVKEDKPDDTKVVETKAETKEKIAKETDNVNVAIESKKRSGDKIIDISKWQGNINFDALDKEVAFVIARASCGSDKDIKFDEYAAVMNDRGIPFGVYCYSYAGTIEKAKDEAQKIIKYAKQYKPLFYVVDAEEERLTNQTISAFADELKKQGAKRIGCYVANHRYKEYNFDSIRDKFDFVWIPKYSDTKPVYKCDLWQYTSTGSVAGINGNVDMNVITGDGHDLEWFLERV